VSAFSHGLVFTRESFCPLVSGRRSFFFSPTLTMIHQREMSVPTRNITKRESGSFPIAGGNITHPIFSLIKDGLFATIATAPFVG
jgi:hypothetical protein